MSHVPGVAPDIPIIVLDDEDRIASDVPCIGCGRNLRGTEQAGRCSHCNIPARKSGRGNALGVAHPAWVSRLAEGPFYIVGSLVLLFVISLVVARGALVPEAIETPVEPSPWSPLIAKLIAGSLCVFGLWLATTPEPVRLRSERQLSLRRCARWGFVAAHVVWLAAGIIAFSHTRRAEWVQLAALAVDTYAMVCMGLWATHLARRIPDSTLAAMSRLFAVAVLVTAAPFIVCTAIKYQSALPSRGGPVTVRTQIAAVSGLGMTACYLLGIMLVFQFRKRLRCVSREAYRSWAA